MLFLTPTDIEDLTDYKLPAKQCDWLRRNGIRHTIGRSGRPKVLKTELDRLLYGGVASAQENPDLSHINGQKTQNG